MTIDDATKDLSSHLHVWRNALDMARVNAEGREEHQIDDRAYWQHELEVFDRVTVALTGGVYNRLDALEEAAKDALASLVAAVSLLERGGKKAAPSDKMFNQMMIDYKNVIERSRAVLLDEAAKNGEHAQKEESVGRAICHAYGNGCGCVSSLHPNCIAVARAAIEAMHKPSAPVNLSPVGITPARCVPENQ